MMFSRDAELLSKTHPVTAVGLFAVCHFGRALTRPMSFKHGLGVSVNRPARACALPHNTFCSPPGQCCCRW